VDKLRVADNLRRHLKRRIALLLDCKPEDLKQQLVGHQIVWADPSEPAEETKPVEKAEVIN